MTPRLAFSVPLQRLTFPRSTCVSSFRRFKSETPKSVWKLENVEANYWDDYVATRPKYDATIFNPIFEYHKAKNRYFNDVLDVGTGAGSALPLLKQRFKRVTASDNDPISLGFAKSRFQHDSPGQISWTMSRAEDLIQNFKPRSFDMITCALTFPLLDTQKALDCMFTLLRPEGTLAIWFYGPPIFTDPVQAARCQPALYAALDHAFRPIVTGGDEQARNNWKLAADGMASWLDYIPFSAHEWKDVRRRKWNNETARLAFFGPDAYDWNVEPTSSVSKDEFVAAEQDPTFWKVEWDVEMVKKFVLAIFPKPDHLNSADKTMEGYFKELEHGIGGANAKASLTWPAVLILARKNAEEA